VDMKLLAERYSFGISSTEPFCTVFTAQSKACYYCKDAVCEFVFRQNKLPINPFKAFDYFLGDRVDRDLIRRANNHLLSLCDELWVFGDIANGVMFEILMAKKLGKPIRFFTIATKSSEIAEVSLRELAFESEMGLTQPQIDEFISLIEKQTYLE